jgi:hypothetical protein
MPDLILGKAFRRCGNCAFTEPSTDGDKAKRVCKGAPPALVALPAKGGILIQSFWPLVQLTDSACAVWKVKPGPDAGDTAEGSA